MNPFEMVAVIVVAVMIASVFRSRYNYKRGCGSGSGEVAPEERAETMRLRDEVKALQERIKVLERITVEKENSLSKEIESLRDR